MCACVVCVFARANVWSQFVKQLINFLFVFFFSFYFYLLFLNDENKQKTKKINNNHTQFHIEGEAVDGAFTSAGDAVSKALKK